jgi:mono/diheme cytochrome c family protein
LSKVAGRGIAILGAAVALAASGQPSAAQDSGKPAQAAAAATSAPANIDKGKQLFNDFGCGSCHSLADAAATGRVGPAFDGDSNLSDSFIVNRVTNGQGAMPAFAGQMSPDDIAAVAAYVMHAASK